MTEEFGSDLDPAVFLRAVDDAFDGIAVTDADGVFVYANHRAAAIAGHDDPAAVVGRHWSTLYAPAERERLAAEIAAAIGERSVWRGRSVGTRPDGSLVPVEMALSLTDTGHVVNVLRDVSEATRREWRLERQNDRLDEFAGVVAHDIRNPLTVARAHVDDIAAETDGDDPRIAAVERALERIDGLVEELLALARDGRIIDDPGPVSLEAVVRDAWANVAVGDARLDVTDDVVTADAGRLEQLLENLFRNAVEHGSTDGPVTVSVRPIAGGGFAVEDDGPGLSEAVRERLERPHSGGRERGIGLRIVRRIADAHGWTVEAGESDAGGARFAFRPASRDRAVLERALE